MPTESDLEYGKRHGFDKLEERENARLAGIDPNASSTAKDGPPAPRRRPRSKQTKGRERPRSTKILMMKTVSPAQSASDSSEGSYMESEGSDSDGSDEEGLNLRAVSQVVTSRWYGLGCGDNQVEF